MNRYLLILLLLTWSSRQATLSAAEPTSTAELAASFEEKMSRIASAVMPEVSQAARLPGVTLAEGITEVTGVAMSPLLGVSTLGAWKYWHADASARARLPWYCQPWAWGLGLAVAGLCLCKDVFGAAIPGIFKKPFDWLELFEDKVSALVAGSAFVPLVGLAISEYQRIHSAHQALTSWSSAGLATAPWAEVMSAALQSPWVTIPLSLMLFMVVWLTSHVVHVLIALSPFSLLDSVLKSAKAAILSLLLLTAAMIPTVSSIPAMILCGVIALVSVLLVGWSFRLLWFGGWMVSDLLFNRRVLDVEAGQEGTIGFLAKSFHSIPVRTPGRLMADPITGQPCFCYRPWLIGPTRRVDLGEGSFVILRGLFHPAFAQQKAQRQAQRWVLLLPRYRGVEQDLAQTLGGLPVREAGLLRGWKAIRQALADLLGSKAAAQEEPPLEKA